MASCSGMDAPVRSYIYIRLLKATDVYSRKELTFNYLY